MKKPSPRSWHHASPITNTKHMAQAMDETKFNELLYSTKKVEVVSHPLILGIFAATFLGTGDHRFSLAMFIGLLLATINFRIMHFSMMTLFQLAGGEETEHQALKLAGTVGLYFGRLVFLAASLYLSCLVLKLSLVGIGIGLGIHVATLLAFAATQGKILFDDQHPEGMQTESALNGSGSGTTPHQFSGSPSAETESG